jgi:transmembrane sensor
MKPNTPRFDESDSAAQAAALWTLRHDRGLTAVEQDQFSQWLAADRKHRAAWAEHRWGWEELDRLAGLQTSVSAVPDPDLLAPRRRAVRTKVIIFSAGFLAAAAGVAFGLFVRPRSRPEPPPVAAEALTGTIEQRTLEDGSVITLNRGAEVIVHYTSRERLVRLVKGEANFQVAKNKERPFIVDAGGVDVRAVGTAFNVQFGGSAVEVVVTEGRVQVEAPARVTDLASTPLNPRPPTILTANQCTTVWLASSAPPRVDRLTSAALESRLAWQPRLLDFTDAPLGDILSEFNRHNRMRLTLGDTGLGELRLSASFRSDNVEGFVRLLESDFGMRAEWRNDEIVLRKTH